MVASPSISPSFPGAQPYPGPFLLLLWVWVFAAGPCLLPLPFPSPSSRCPARRRWLGRFSFSLCLSLSLSGVSLILHKACIGEQLGLHTVGKPPQPIAICCRARPGSAPEEAAARRSPWRSAHCLDARRLSERAS